MKKIKGQSFNIEEYIIGRITFKNDVFKTNKVLVANKFPKILYGINALIMPELPKKPVKIPIFVSNSKELFEDDIVNITKDGNCNVIWEINANHNAIFVTDACNSKCIMCPQPMPENPKNYFADNQKLVGLLNKKHVQSLGITGGEPTLNIVELCKLLKKIKIKFQNIPMHILTNGRQFAKKKNLDEILKVKGLDITYAVPLYSDIEDEHDYIVGCNGAFNETIKGLYNLAKAQQKVEIRIVVMKQNYKKLLNIAEFIYRNLPFVTHVAIMTMEYTGLAEKNFNEVFIDPITYKEELFKAMRQFNRYNIEASIYNTPLCLLDRRIWDFSADSISDWKKTFVDECEGCKGKSRCSGVFSTSFTQSRSISKIESTHKKPLEPSPSKLLAKYADDIVKNIDGKILDVACGYGRNAGFLASFGFPVICIDNNDDALNYINTGKNLTTYDLKNPELLSTIKMNLKVDKWDFEDESISVIINSHFFLPELIPNFAKSLKVGGYLFIETIDARGRNYLELPQYGYIRDCLSSTFEFIYYDEKKVEPLESNTAKVKLLARKIKSI